jgi:glycosyltransferase involved in cell wall biosynthesis
MENQLPLISILVPCYNNQQYLFESLKSIFEQTYPAIEVLIGDDGSNNFNAESLINWINKNRTPNIKKIIIIENKENLGTVANLGKLQKASSGEFLFNLAADDVLYDCHVLQNFYNKILEIGPDAEMIVAQTELWDSQLKNKIGAFLSEEGISIIKKSTPQQLFAECSYRPFLPASYLYRRLLLKKVGSLAGQYRLIEDWPLQLRAMRMGVQPYYLDIVSSIKHRDGGISHGNKLHSSQTYLAFYHDLLNVYLNEVKPYQSMLSQADAKRAEKYFRDRVYAYYNIHLPNYRKQHNKVLSEGTVSPNNAGDQFAASAIGQLSKKQLIKMKIRQKVKLLAFYLARNKVIYYTLVMMVLFFIAAGAINTLPNKVGTALCVFFLLDGTFFMLLVVAEVAVKILLTIRHYLQNRSIGQ